MYRELRGPMRCRCMMFNLSGPVQLLFYSVFYCLFDLSCYDCNVPVVNVEICLWTYCVVCWIVFCV